MRWWIKCIAALAAIALMICICVALGRVLLKTLNVLQTGGASEPDPMFAPEEEWITRPPELAEETRLPDMDAEYDPSMAWNDAVQTPVDKTAEELAREEDILS